jgi:hypothetical protein
VEGPAQFRRNDIVSKAKKSATQQSKPAAKKPALPNRRSLSAIEADIAATQTDDTANLIRRGEYLIEAKESEQIAHGEWTRWLSNNFDLSERTAQSQMQVARFVAGLGKNETIAVLNLSKSALYTISADDYHAVDCIPAILQEASKRFLTPRDVKRVIYKYREEHKTPEEREAERLAAEERRDLIAKAGLQWAPDDDPDGNDGDLKVETRRYIYKIVPQGEDDGDNKVFEPQRWWKDGSSYSPLRSPLTGGYRVPLDEAKAVCAKDVIEEAEQQAKWGADDESETSEPDSGASPEGGEETEPTPEATPPKPDQEKVLKALRKRAENLGSGYMLSYRSDNGGEFYLIDKTTYDEINCGSGSLDEVARQLDIIESAQLAPEVEGDDAGAEEPEIEDEEGAGTTRNVGSVYVHTDNPRQLIELLGAVEAEAFARGILTELLGAAGAADAVLEVVEAAADASSDELSVAPPPKLLAGLDAGQIVDLILELPKSKVNAITHDLLRETTAKPVPAPEVNEAPPADEAAHLAWKKTTGADGYCYEAGNYFIAPMLNAEKKFCGCTVSYKGEVLQRDIDSHLKAKQFAEQHNAERCKEIAAIKFVERAP